MDIIFRIYSQLWICGGSWPYIWVGGARPKLQIWIKNPDWAGSTWSSMLTMPLRYPSPDNNRFLMLLRHFAKHAFMFLSEFFLIFSVGFCLHGNLRTHEPIVFTFLSVINHGHWKIHIVFITGTPHHHKLFKGGGGVCVPPPLNYWITQWVVLCRAIASHYWPATI